MEIEDALRYYKKSVIDGIDWTLRNWIRENVMKQRRSGFLYALFLLFAHLLFSVMSFSMSVYHPYHPPIYLPRCPSVLSGTTREFVDFRSAERLHTECGDALRKKLHLEELRNQGKIQKEKSYLATIILRLKRGGRWEDVPEGYQEAVQEYAVKHEEWDIIDAIIRSVYPQ